MLEAGAQADVALQKSLHGRLECALLEPPLEIKRKLHGVDVRRLSIIEGVEQQAFLQWRERQDLLEIGVLALQPLDLCLGESDQRKIRGSAPTTARPAGLSMLVVVRVQNAG